MLPPVGILTAEEMSRAVSLVLEFEDIFVGPDGKVGFTHRVKHWIDTEGHEPVKIIGYQKSLVEKQYIAEEVKKLEENGQIRKSQSPWAAQVVLVAYKDSTKCFCICFQKLIPFHRLKSA